MKRFSIYILVLSSLFYYGYWKPSYLSIIIVSIAFNFILGRILSNFKSKTILFLGVAANTIALIYYKYAYFILENIKIIYHLDLDVGKVILPLAISFFTFQQIAYLVDSYKRDIREQDFLSYSLFVSFFPQLIAGPIVHHKEMMSQFQAQQNGIKWENIQNGITRFALGLFKKTVVADSMIHLVSAVFDSGLPISTKEAWMGSFAYTFQLYFDFSAYSDMAIGSALLFNIIIPENFNSPYKSRNLQTFWRRWHITLGRWLKDYIYIPLGGNRRGMHWMYFNMLVTFLIGGIWHGAGWNFLIWGALHGFGIVFSSFFSKKLWQGIPLHLGSLITFLYVHFSWIFFEVQI